jgi:hypothetical protein
MAKIGVEPARGDFKAKNILGEVVTQDRKEWRPIEQSVEPAAKASAKAATSTGAVTPIAKPAWAK